MLHIAIDYYKIDIQKEFSKLIWIAWGICYTSKFCIIQKYTIRFPPGRMLFTTARKAFPSLQLGPKSLTWTPSCLETWAWTHWSRAFLAPTFHFSWVFLLVLPSRTDLKWLNLQVRISILANLAEITGHHQCCLHNHVCQH